jgi:hypothetical protein
MKDFGMSPWLAVGAAVGLVAVVVLVLVGVTYGSKMVQRWGDHSVRGPHGRDSL